uniref:H0114G12.3 protein n=1 Tax=Oryza sativa TaxID=4530 RepID=Q25AR7_ORYSA|nr:H0313F03.19 [Oryza sativa]CAJ86390.1 H0114G12.3 [Oryza sativa]
MRRSSLVLDLFLIDRDLSGKATNGKWGNLYGMDSSVQFYWKHLNTHQIRMWYIYVMIHSQGNLYSRVYDDPVEEEGTALDEAGNFNNDLENNIEEKSLEQAGRDCRFWSSCCSNTSYCQQRPRAAGGPHKITEVGEFVWGLQMKFVISGHLAKGHDKLAVIKEETNIEDLIKDEKAEDVELNMIVDEVVLVGNGLAGALQFLFILTFKCKTIFWIANRNTQQCNGLSVVEKEHPRSLTPMLWAKKVAMIFPVPLRNYFTFGNVCLVQIYSNLPYSETCYSAFLCQVEHFSEHQTKRPCWEQCLRHLQRDRRTEPAVDLTVWSRFRALTDSNDRASEYTIFNLRKEKTGCVYSTGKEGRRRKRPKHGGGGPPPTEEKEAKARLVDLSGTVGVRREEKRVERRGPPPPSSPAPLSPPPPPPPIKANNTTKLILEQL